jgi:hypothetical protein
MSEEKPKKINTNAKGYRNEQKTARYLEKLGYVVCTTQRSSHRGNNDFFNAFDHIAVIKHDCTRPIAYEAKTKLKTSSLGTVLFVQTRSNRKGNTDKIVEFANSTQFYPYAVLIFVWKDREARPYIYSRYGDKFTHIEVEDNMKTI